VFWRTHDASPGEPVSYGDTLALELYWQAQRHGLEAVLQLRTLRLTEQEAEALFLRLDWLTEHLPQMIQAFYGQGQGQAPMAEA
jgi:hypothetical protein